MLSKDALKKISSYMAAVMIAGCSAAVFADNTGVTVLENQTGDTANSGSAGGGQSGSGDTSENPSGGDETPETMAINISANYFKTEAENTYNIIVSSLDYLEGYKDFSFTLSFGAADVKLSNPEFGEKLKSDDENTVISSAARKITFSHGAPTELQSGKLGLCSIELKSAAVPTKDNITIIDFTAVDKDGKTITFAPNLTVV